MATQRVKYQLGSTANYRYNIVKIGFTEYDDLAYMHKKEFPDVEITRPSTDTDLERVHKTCLMTVNGYIYNSLFQANRLYIPGATASMLRSKANVTGVLDFSGFTNNLIRRAITPSMVTTEHNILAYDKVFITFPTEVVQPMLVMAGYLVPYNPEYFYRVSDTSFVLCLSKLNYTEKLFETMRYRDIFKDLGVAVSEVNPQLVDANVVRSLATIRKYLSLNNSFMVDLATSNLTTSKIYLEHSNIPSVFKTQVEPKLPMVVGYGKLNEYSVTKNADGVYSVYTQDAVYSNHLVSHMSAQDVQVYNDHRVPGDVHRLSQGFFLSISTQT